LRTVVSPAREGKRIAALQVSLLAGDVEVSRAAALALRTTEVELPARALPPPPWAPHHEGYPTTDLPSALRPPGAPAPKGPALKGFHTTVEVRRVDEGAGLGSATAWIRIPVPFVLGEETGPLTRLAATSDFGSPLGHVRASADTGFINADISIHLHRLPEGEWICLEARGAAQPTGLGLVETVVHDIHGPIGRVNQAIMVNRRFGAQA